jgi:hypothetical protein
MGNPAPKATAFTRSRTAPRLRVVAGASGATCCVASVSVVICSFKPILGR